MRRGFSMHKMKDKIVTVLLVGTLALGEMTTVQAASIRDCGTASECTELVPYVLTTGTVEDIQNMKSYEVSIAESEKQKVILPITVAEAGMVNCEVTCKSTIVTAGAVSVKVYKNAECTEGISTDINMALEGSGKSAKTSFYADTPGSYYCLFSVSESAKTAEDNFLFTIGLQEISSSERVLTDKVWTKSYQTGEKSDIYYKIIVKKTGVISLETVYEEENFGAPVVTLCNSKKEKISLETEHNKENSFKSVFPVKKGTYYAKASNIQGNYQLRYVFSKINDKSGSKKTKAKALSVGGKKIKGVMLVSDKKSKYDWYKFTLRKAAPVRVDFKGSTTGKTKLQLEVIPPSVARFSQRPILSFKGLEQNGSGQSAEFWPAGIWYIRINKSEAKGGGMYTLKVKTIK